MRELILTAGTAALMALAGCGTLGNARGKPAGSGTAADTDTVNVSASNVALDNSSVTIRPDQAVTFVDPATTGGLHSLLTGTNGTLTTMPGVPAVSSTPKGISINGGDTKANTFAIAGTSMITCTIHP